jgi:hypothetical protein
MKYWMIKFKKKQKKNSIKIGTQKIEHQLLNVRTFVWDNNNIKKSKPR